MVNKLFLMSNIHSSASDDKLVNTFWILLKVLVLTSKAHMPIVYERAQSNQFWLIAVQMLIILFHHPSQPVTFL